eukprot:893327-Prymnesium_polylepis.1
MILQTPQGPPAPGPGPILYVCGWDEGAGRHAPAQTNRKAQDESSESLPRRNPLGAKFAVRARMLPMSRRFVCDRLTHRHLGCL